MRSHKYILDNTVIDLANRRSYNPQASLGAWSLPSGYYSEVTILEHRILQKSCAKVWEISTRTLFQELSSSSSVSSEQEV